MPHIYNEIQGWFDFGIVYDHMINKFPNGHFVEVGCWFGKSSVYLLEKIKETNSNVIVDFVDTWLASPRELEQLEILKRKDVYREFLENIKKIDLNYSGRILKMESVLAAKEYENLSLDMVYIDADHAYSSIYSDIKAWLPKVKNGGILAGHDFDWPDVNKAVKELLSVDIKAMIPNTWVFEKYD